MALRASCIVMYGREELDGGWLTGAGRQQRLSAQTGGRCWTRKGECVERPALDARGADERTCVDVDVEAVLGGEGGW